MRIRRLAAIALFATLGCGDSTTSPTTTQSGPPALEISGSVTQFEVVPTSTGNFADINYEVTITSNRAATGCFIEVKWLNANNLQIASTFAATDADVPAGTSRVTNQDFDDIGTATSIRNSQVEFSLCN